MRTIESWKRAARRLKRELRALHLAIRDPRVPWYARALGAIVVAYAFSPIDLIPDFIPVLGYLDDLVLVPAGIALTMWLIPPEVMADCRLRAEQAAAAGKPVNRAAAIAIVAIWLLLAGWGISMALRALRSPAA